MTDTAIPSPPTATTQRRPDVRSALRRPRKGRWVGGVAAGVARWSGLPPWFIRLAIVALTLVIGIGIALYGLGWLLIPADGTSQSIAVAALRGESRWRAVLAGLALLVVGAWVLDAVVGSKAVGPALLVVVGALLLWRQVALDPQRSHGRVVRIGVGAALVVTGLALLVGVAGAADAARSGAVAAAAVIVGLGLIAAPSWIELTRALARERAERIRSQERAEVAAHVHDSMLQTLTLIQRSAGDPTEVASLARRQERELRDWLYGRDAAPAGDTFAAALRAVAAEVEDRERIEIETVLVGDHALDEAHGALVLAVREALTNAARHSGERHVSLFAESDGDRTTAFVRDRGRGFDPAGVPADRHGVRDSIVARLQRHDGAAAIHSTTGEGTEVELSLGRDER